MLEKKIYLDSGYLNFSYIMGLNYPFTFIIGARGVGKTYGGLDYIYTNRLKYIHLRRTQVQADLLSSNAFMPYKQLCVDNGWNICSVPVIGVHELPIGGILCNGAGIVYPAFAVPDAFFITAVAECC